MRHFPMIALLFGLLLSMNVQIAEAQGLGSLFTPSQSSEDEQSSSIDDIIQRATEKGVGVIIVDSSGNVLTETGGSAAGEDASAEGSAAQGISLMQMQDRAVKFRAALVERFMTLPQALAEVFYILRASSPDGTLMPFLNALITSLSLFGLGYLFEVFIFRKRILRRFVVARIREHPVGYAEKMPFLVLRFVLGVVGILVSMAVAYLIGFTVFGTLKDSAMQYTVSLINIGYFSFRFIAILWRMILSPFLPQYRIPALDDHDAKRLFRWLCAVAALDICTILIIAWVRELGLNYDVFAFLNAGLSGLIVLINILMVLVNRRAISSALRHGRAPMECSLLVRVLSQLWAPIVILYVIYAWGALTYALILGDPGDVPLIAGAYVILLSIIVVYGVINFVIERSFARARAIRRMNAIREEEAAQASALAQAETAGTQDQQGVAHRAEELEETRAAAAEEAARSGGLASHHPLNTYEALARRVAGILAFCAGVYAFFSIWDTDSTAMVETHADRLLDVMGILFIGYIGYHVFRIWIDGKIREEVGDEEETGELGDEGGGSSASRLATLLPLFRNLTLIVVIISVILFVLMELGINVGPLFAGAGIVGVAIGFGSQALVRDIFAGAFFLFDDAFRKGEYLDVGGVKGTVEKISVRSFQLRHHLGALHTIPFGELQVMTNYSRDWVMMKLPLRVTYDTDVDHVRKLVKKLGQKLLEDPEIGPDFIQPLKSQGVIEMQDSAMIIRVKFMTKPGDQWVIRKRVYEEIRALFEREGIKFAHREVTVRLADGKVDDLTEAQKQSVTAAAEASIEEDLLEGGVQEAGGDDR